jgi:hypothetical protein
MPARELKEHPAQRRFWVAAGTVAMIGAIAGVSFTVIGVAQDARHSEHATTDVASEAPQGMDVQRGFDYFPDHYQLQAKDPAEQIATF